MDVPSEVKNIKCPVCGQIYPIRIVKLEGLLKFSLRCKKCKHISEIVLKDI